MKQETIKILDTPFTTLYKDEILDLIRDLLKKPASQFFLATPNPEMLLASEKDPQFKQTLISTNLNIPDGNGIIWANIFLKSTANDRNRALICLKGFFSYLAFLFHQKNEMHRFNQAIHGSDLMKAICLDHDLNRHGIFLLGNRHGIQPYISQATAQAMKRLDDQINIAGFYDGSPDDPGNVEKINAAKPEILFVGFGSPQQEIWLEKNLAKLKTVKIAIGVGGSFDFMAGAIQRAPTIMRKIGLEWLYRLYKQPKRYKRIINAALVFPVKVISARTKDLH